MTATASAAIDATFPANADAPRAARALVTQLGGTVDEQLAIDLRLLLSDVVTDRVLDQAVAGASARLRVELSSDDAHVHACVSDVLERPPTARMSSSLSERPAARALLMALADSWATTSRPDGAVSVWLTLRASRAGRG